MSKATKELVRQHQECDDQLTRSETALQKGEVSSAISHFRLFSEQLDSHFRLEEERLFPAFEKATGMSQGPTQVMRGEHADIRTLRDEAYAAMTNGQTAAALAAIDTLNVLIQQHNVKEENVLYPLCAERIADLDTSLGMNTGSPCCGACSCG
ncbi:hemerythrin domain-containing protein [Undibacterium sp. TS12]|uniref:hemerythrin domain-containing protein n=1 Tax=Undibacterium sp. TS12 TaxID=2908202 RepID=UPI001F4C80B4|nr:hemerythrin domain-containing protein [Undibacterium sp. TS12]MCH8622725.1 hemerythrin domain-containing protein [Undibacterium sp. TS12]